MFGATLAILSTIIGGGIVGLPYSFYHCGIPMGIILNIVFAFLTFYSCVLFIEAKILVGNLSSLSEIGFLLQGRKSIFIVNTIVFIGTFQLMIIYFIILGDISASFAVEILQHEKSFWATRPPYVLAIAFIMLTVIFKKGMHEFKIASVFLFISILLFIVVFSYQLVDVGPDENDD